MSLIKKIIQIAGKKITFNTFHKYNFAFNF